ncbi:nuclear transport factor 2 family protein [Variovorax sp. GT1P44]|uniref:nuclear transport factor 2 family protein n=1 Tax=Variovorax sp. GT1P44 TaxID=3443742 RepID=UPI003F47C8DE
MTTEERNVEALREGYRLWNDSKADSAQHWMNMMTDDIRWRSLGAGAAGSESTRECCSKQDVQRYFQQLGEQWELVSYTADEFIAQGDRVVMLGSCAWRHRTTQKVARTPKVDVFRFRGGKVADFSEYYDTAAVLAAAT